MGGEGGEDGDGSGGDVRVREVEIVTDADADCVPEIGSEARGADEVEGELLGHGGGRSRHDFLHCGFGQHRDVSPRGGLLERLEESASLAERIVRTEVGLDLGEENVHLQVPAPDPNIFLFLLLCLVLVRGCDRKWKCCTC